MNSRPGAVHSPTTVKRLAGSDRPRPLHRIRRRLADQGFGPSTPDVPCPPSPRPPQPLPSQPVPPSPQRQQGVPRALHLVERPRRPASSPTRGRATSGAEKLPHANGVDVARPRLRTSRGNVGGGVDASPSSARALPARSAKRRGPPCPPPRRTTTSARVGPDARPRDIGRRKTPPRERRRRRAPAARDEPGQRRCRALLSPSPPSPKRQAQGSPVPSTSPNDHIGPRHPRRAAARATACFIFARPVVTTCSAGCSQ